jgi:hypothetical protein
MSYPEGAKPCLLTNHLKTKLMRVIRINTTAWQEEDFYLVTNLWDKDIVETIRPLVESERSGEMEYDNQILVQALKDKFPLAYVDIYEEFDKLIF